VQHELLVVRCIHSIPGLGFLVLLGDALTGNCFFVTVVAAGDTAFLCLGGVAILSSLLAVLLSAVSSSLLSLLLSSVVASSLLLSLHSTQGYVKTQHCMFVSMYMKKRNMRFKHATSHEHN
jgi:hypothetical protein